MRLILASSSKYRAQVLEKSGIYAESIAPDIDETALPGELPEQLALRLAIGKAEAVTCRHNNCLVIGSDQVAVLNGEILGKPGSYSAAREQLSKAQGHKAVFYTGLALINGSTGNIQSRVNATEVAYRELTPAEIDNYLRADEPYDCAGSFKSEGLGITILKSIGGDDPNSLVGLPVIALLEMLRNEGYNPIG